MQMGSIFIGPGKRDNGETVKNVLNNGFSVYAEQLRAGILAN